MDNSKKEQVMISFDQALSIVLDATVELGGEPVPLCNACGRILHQDIRSDIDMPPFDKSAMDGYACRAQDLERPLHVIETIAAGSVPQKTVGEGECSKIMTGAMVPRGADCVVMIEHTTMNGGMVQVTRINSERNISYKAEDVTKDDIVLTKGTLITPAEIAVLASVGCDPVFVFRKPVVTIIATGSELVEPSEKPGPGQIRNSNSYQLVSQITQAGGQPVYLGIIGDTPQATGECIDQNLAKADIFIFSGGVSMGEFDYVPGVLKAKGFELLFQKVAVKPGKPTVFGRKENTYVFGLPGNPVSTFAIFELLVKPFCQKLMGRSYAPFTVRAPLAETITRKKADRLAILPVLLDEQSRIRPIRYHGSAHIHALTQANGFLLMAQNVFELKEGESVAVVLIR